MFLFTNVFFVIPFFDRGKRGVSNLLKIPFSSEGGDATLLAVSRRTGTRFFYWKRAMTLRKLFQLIGEYLSALWNQILDMPLWLLALVVATIIFTVLIASYGRYKDEVKRQERMKKAAGEFWKDTTQKEDKEDE